MYQNMNLKRLMEWIDKGRGLGQSGPVKWGGANENAAALPNYEQLKYYAGEYLYQLDCYQTEAEDALEKFIPSEEFQVKTIAEIKEEAKQQEIADAEMYEEMQSCPQMYAVSYDANAAAQYARKYAKKYNKEYNGHFKDCTNFVSQALYAGGGYGKAI